LHDSPLERRLANDRRRPIPSQSIALVPNLASHVLCDPRFSHGLDYIVARSCARLGKSLQSARLARSAETRERALLQLHAAPRQRQLPFEQRGLPSGQLQPSGPYMSNQSARLARRSQQANGSWAQPLNPAAIAMANRMVRSRRDIGETPAK
jgi:hypothetical protein